MQEFDLVITVKVDGDASEKAPSLNREEVVTLLQTIVDTGFDDASREFSHGQWTEAEKEKLYFFIEAKVK